ncbi:MAG: hypothetical protein EAZ24_17080 [Burkholderiales bacterium]|nr:MAG: hypothetical protein EAZ24_17080 [Burkholderiales bacterium]
MRSVNQFSLKWVRRLHTAEPQAFHPTQLMIRFASFILLALTACHPCIITPSEMTHSAIGETFYRIHLYAKANGTLPASLTILPTRENYSNSVIDGWGKPLLYATTAYGALSLTSWGSDGLPGGVGDAVDITVSYRGKDENGRIIAGDELWIVKGKVENEP